MRLFIVIYSCFMCWSVYAQNTISGTITTEKGFPLPDVHVHIATKATASKPDGTYVLKEIPTGMQKAYVAAIGYTTLERQMEINGNVTINFQLHEQVVVLKDMEIKESITKKNSNSVQHIGITTIEQASNSSLATLLKEVSGVAILKTGSTIMKPVINGLHSSRVPIINQNVRMEDQQWGTEHAPNFDVNTAGRITIIKGASALQYGGDAVGGVIVIEPELLKKDTLQAKTILNLASNGRGGSITSMVQKARKSGFSWTTLGTFKYEGDKTGPAYVLTNSGARGSSFAGTFRFTGDQFHWNSYYSYYQSEVGILKAAHIGNVTDLYEAIATQTPNSTENFSYSIAAPKQEVHHHLGKISYQFRKNDTSTLDFQYAFQHNQRYEYDLRRSATNTKAALDLALTTHSFSGIYSFLIQNLNVKSGIQAGYQNNFSDPKTGVRPLIPSYSKLETGLFAIVSYKQNNATTFEAGIRYDFAAIEASKYYLKSRWEERNYSVDFSQFIVREEGNQLFTKPRFLQHNWAANIGFRKQFHHEFEWIMNVSLATRTPNISEWFSDGLHHANGQIELGDLRLKQEKAYKWNTTLKKDWKKVTATLQPFVNRVSGFIYLQPIGFETTIRGAFPVWEYRQTEALLSGVDLSAHWNWNSNLQHDLNLSVVNGYNLTHKNYLIDMPPVQVQQTLAFMKKEWHHLKIALKNEIVFTKKYYPNYDFQTTILINEQLTPVVVPISKPPKGYSLLHFYTEMAFPMFEKKKITVAFSVQNVTNKVYRDYLNKQRFFADEMGSSFHVQLKFNY